MGKWKGEDAHALSLLSLPISVQTRERERQQGHRQAGTGHVNCASSPSSSHHHHHSVVVTLLFSTHHTHAFPLLVFYMRTHQPSKLSYHSSSPSVILFLRALLCSSLHPPTNEAGRGGGWMSSSIPVVGWVEWKLHIQTHTLSLLSRSLTSSLSIIT